MSQHANQRCMCRQATMLGIKNLGLPVSAFGNPKTTMKGCQNHYSTQPLENKLNILYIHIYTYRQSSLESSTDINIYPRLPKALNFGVEAKRPYKNEVVLKTLKFKVFGRTAALWDQVWSNIIVEKNDSQGTISNAIALIWKYYEIWVLSRKFGSFSRKFGSFHANLGPFHANSR